MAEFGVIENASTCISVKSICDLNESTIGETEDLSDIPLITARWKVDTSADIMVYLVIYREKVYTFQESLQIWGETVLLLVDSFVQSCLYLIGVHVSFKALQ